MVKRLKVKFTVAGENVHGVGYRAMLLNRAFSLGIDRFSVFNSAINGKQAVIVLVDAGEEQVDALRNFVESYRPEKASVDEIKEGEYEGKVPSIDRTMQAFQTEQWSEGIPVLLEIRDNTRLIPEIAENTRLIPELLKKQDDLRNTVEKGLDELKQEHIKTREMSHEIFYSEVQELRRELKDLRTSVEEIKRKVGIA